MDILWKLVQDKFKADELTEVKAKELWVHFRRLYEQDPSDRHWRFEAHNLNILWKFYDSCEIHHVSTQAGVDVFMLAEKEYPLRSGILTVMMSSKLRCEEKTQKVEDLLQRIHDQCERASRE